MFGVKCDQGPYAVAEREAASASVPLWIYEELEEGDRHVARKVRACSSFNEDESFYEEDRSWSANTIQHRRARRNASVSDFSDLTPGAKPEKSLLRPLRKKGGRNNQGKITARHRGGGHKRRYRIIDFRRDKDGVPAVVDSIQYDPNRSARIALLKYEDGEKRYILAPEGLKVGNHVESGAAAPPNVGNCLPLTVIPLGTAVHNVEMQFGAGRRAVSECRHLRHADGPAKRGGSS